MKKNKRAIFCYVLFILAFIFYSLLGIYYYARFRSHNRLIYSNERQAVRLQYNSVKAGIEIAIDDLVLLSEHTKVSDIHHIEPDKVQKALDRLKNEFKAFSMARYQLYDQLRYINTDGDEIVRINFNQGSPSVVEESDLQNKKNRYYFRDIIKLNAGDIYISPMDLNIEHGLIEMPIKPMIRLGTPIYDSKNNRKGIVVLNYLAETILQSFREHNSLNLGLNMMVNRDGYWLENSSGFGKWAFMYPDSSHIRFDSDFGTEWPRIYGDHEGQFKTEKGLFTFSTVYPLPENIYSSTGSPHAFMPSEKTLNSEQYFWKLISFLPTHLIQKSRMPIWQEVVKVSAIILLIIALISLVLSIAIHKRIKAEKDLIQVNNNLEKIVSQRTHELVAAKEKAEESDKLKTAFLQNMSHEIRTPMNGIIGFTGLLKDQHLTIDKRMEYINLILISGERMLNTINDLMDISLIEAGQVNISFQDVDLKEQFENIYTFFERTVTGKGLKFRIKYLLSEGNSSVRTDKEKLFMIITNLINNALKFTDRGFIEFGCRKRDKYIVFYVSDSGIGIPKDKLSSIFDRFVQAESDLSRNYEGSGLGLAISKAYVELLGGRIWVESDVGKGTRFYFTIPLIQIGEAVNKVGQRSILTNDSLPRNLKILIVDDDDASRFLLKEMVSEYCSEVLQARNGFEAVEICMKKTDLDLVFMDIKMPELNGFEATRQIKSFNSNLLIVAQTAYASEEDRKKTLLAGCDNYIPKPVQKDEIIGIMHEHFSYL